MLHAHIDSYTTDCDGPISRSRIETLDPERDIRPGRFDDDGELAFRQRVLSNIVSAYTTWDGTLTVTGDEMGGLTQTLEWTERHEEGIRHVTAEFCTNDCDLGESSYRDHRAESMGY